MTVPSIASNEVCLKLANNFGNRNLLLADVADFFFADCGSGRTLERPPRRRRRWTESATGSAAPPPRSPNHSTAAPRVRLIRAESSCARGAPRQAPSVRQRHPHSGGQQSDPRSDRPDPLEPAGRRFADFVFAIFRFGANAGARAFAANDRSCGRRGAGRALRGTGSWKTRGIERSAFDTRYSASGRPLELGRSGRTIDHAAAAAPGARCEVRGHGKHAALKDQRLIPALALFAPNPRARGARRARRRRSGSATHIQVVSRATRDQTTRPARAGWAALRRFRFRDIPLRGERWSSGVRGKRSIMRPPRRRARAARYRVMENTRH